MLDIFGAFALALAFMAKRPERIAEEVTTRTGANPDLAESMASQTADAWVGFVLLALGFSAQLASNLGFSPDWASWKVTIPIALSTLRPLMVQRVIGKLDARFSK